MTTESRSRRSLEAYLASLLGQTNIGRLDEALTHPSYSNEHSTPDNQRLEFLGDAVLGLCVSMLLIEAYPGADEGVLTRMRSSLVNAEALSTWARRIELGNCLLLGRGARGGNEREQTNVLADAVEALVAAVFLASGLEGAKILVQDVVASEFSNAAILAERDPKSALQEYLQSEGKPTPTYRVVAISGPSHTQLFEVELSVQGVVLSKGHGRSKKAAERSAAHLALSQLRSEASTRGNAPRGSDSSASD
jgi:ribonuclease-3